MNLLDTDADNVSVPDSEKGALQTCCLAVCSSRSLDVLERPAYNIAEMNFELLPGNELITSGIRDLQSDVESVPALLVSIGAPRLRRLGFPIPEETIAFPEIRLYEQLRQPDPDAAHSRYNALIRRLVSFERAAECGR